MAPEPSNRVRFSMSYRVGTLPIALHGVGLFGRRLFGVGILCLVMAACSTSSVSTPPEAPAPRWPVLSYNPSPILIHKDMAAVPQTLSRGDRRIRRSDPRFRPGPPPRPSVVSWRRRLQCVPFARKQSKIAIRGHSWHWWRAAKGKYRRGRMPHEGAVLVFKRNRQSRGHLAVVTRLINSREIVVNHANWLNKGRIHMDTPIRDVSRNNDWSVVKVWYTPGRKYGSSRYRVHGFIYPELQTAAR